MLHRNNPVVLRGETFADMLICMQIWVGEESTGGVESWRRVEAKTDAKQVKVSWSLNWCEAIGLISCFNANTNFRLEDTNQYFASYSWPIERQNIAVITRNILSFELYCIMHANTVIAQHLLADPQG